MNDHPPLGGTRSRSERRRASRWTWSPTPEYERGPVPAYVSSLFCPMVSSTGKRCVRGYRHARGHSTTSVRPRKELLP